MLNFLIDLLACSAQIYLTMLINIGVILIPEFLFQYNEYRSAVTNQKVLKKIEKVLKKIEVANTSRPAPPSGGSGVPNNNTSRPAPPPIDGRINDKLCNSVNPIDDRITVISATTTKKLPYAT